MTATKDIQQAFKERLDYDELMNCMRCGFACQAVRRMAKRINMKQRHRAEELL